MILSRRVALNGQSLDELYGRIVIRGIDFGAPDENIQAVSRMGRFGQRIIGDRYEKMEVNVRWAMDVPKTDLITRRRIYEDVCQWALQAGWMTVNFLPDRRLYVDRAIIKAPGDIREWTEEYTITFMAYSVPFWQDSIPSEITRTSYSGGNLTLLVRGQYTTVAEVEFKNTSGNTLDSFSITAGGSTISLSSLGLPDGKILKIFHEDNGLLRITADGTSALSKRSGSSADDLYVNPGNVAVTITTERSGDLALRCFGRYA